MISIGIVGLNPGTSWAAQAHIPALQALSDEFRVVGVANSSVASAREAAAHFGLPHAFESPHDLATCSDVDLVVVAVRVPFHYELTELALRAGKHVYCEWPLGNGLEEAVALAFIAREQGVVAVAGTQAVASPEIAFLRDLVAQGFVGEVLSTTLIGSGMAWSGSVLARNTYLLDPGNGATILTIPFGHALAGLQSVLGDVTEVSATMANRRKSSTVLESGDALPLTAPDQLLVQGRLNSGALLAAHYRGGLCGATNLLWEINGTDGDLRVTGASGHIQMMPLTVTGGKSGQALSEMELPTAYLDKQFVDGVAGNVGRVYALMAGDIGQGSWNAPSFDDAVALHRKLEAIERSAVTGCRVSCAS